MWPFKKSEEKSVKCIYESATSDCSLVQKLKELQAQKKEIDKSIKDYEENNCIIADNFIKVLVKLENNGCFMFCNDRTRWDSSKSGVRQYFDHYGARILEDSLSSFSMHNIQQMCDEIKELVNKANVLAEKRELSKRLVVEIKEIKDVLGIE